MSFKHIHKEVDLILDWLICSACSLLIPAGVRGSKLGQWRQEPVLGGSAEVLERGKALQKGLDRLNQWVEVNGVRSREAQECYSLEGCPVEKDLHQVTVSGIRGSSVPWCQ